MLALTAELLAETVKGRRIDAVAIAAGETTAVFFKGAKDERSSDETEGCTRRAVKPLRAAMGAINMVSALE